MTASNTITVSPGVQLAYTDTGPPKEVASYVTIFAIHGMCFTNLTFEKLQTVALNKGFRIVAINRRHFPGSTPYNDEEIKLITNPDASADRRSAFIECRGHEIAQFIDIFSQKFGLPPISKDGKTGGCAILGWSMGSQFAAAVIAYAHTLPLNVQSQLSQHIRGLVVYDAAPSIFGLPTLDKNWAPLIDTTVPEHLRLPMFGQWVTGYFDNGDYAKRDVDTLAYVLMSTDRTPAIFNQNLSQAATYGQEAALDLPLLFFCAEQLKATFYEAFGGQESRKLFPTLKASIMCADRTPSFGLSGLWAVQDALKEAGRSEDDIKFMVVKGENHFMHWENPEKALEAFTANI